MIDTISQRTTEVMRALTQGQSLSRADIQQAPSEPRMNVIRELGHLIDLGYVVPLGGARATRYVLTDAGRRVVLWDTEQYLAREPDQRQARYTHLEPGLLTAVDGIVGEIPSWLKEAAQERRRPVDDVTAQKELERFIIELSWKSSKIEGNTYTLLDTERLIRESTEAAGHTHDEAVMILNHKRAFEYIWQHQSGFRRLTRRHLEEVHQLLVDGLGVPTGLRTGGVGITGTVYVPPASKVEISTYLDDIIRIINGLASPAAPLEKALACLVLLPYLQPFADGNKRTSRLLANAVLLAHGLPPLSYRSIDEQAYKGGRSPAVSASHGMILCDERRRVCGVKR